MKLGKILLIGLLLGSYAMALSSVEVYGFSKRPVREKPDPQCNAEPIKLQVADTVFSNTGRIIINGENLPKNPNGSISSKAANVGDVCYRKDNPPIVVKGFNFRPGSGKLPEFQKNDPNIRIPFRISLHNVSFAFPTPYDMVAKWLDTNQKALSEFPVKDGFYLIEGKTIDSKQNGYIFHISTNADELSPDGKPLTFKCFFKEGTCSAAYTEDGVRFGMEFLNTTDGPDDNMKRAFGYLEEYLEPLVVEGN